MYQAEEIMKRWLDQKDLDKTLKEELLGLDDREEIRDRFYRELEFGTGGLRGILGAGTNRMNIYTVRKATQGFADYLNFHYGPGSENIPETRRRRQSPTTAESIPIALPRKLPACLRPTE